MWITFFKACFERRHNIFSSIISFCVTTRNRFTCFKSNHCLKLSLFSQFALFYWQNIINQQSEISFILYFIYSVPQKSDVEAIGAPLRVASVHISPDQSSHCHHGVCIKMMTEIFKSAVQTWLCTLTACCSDKELYLGGQFEESPPW